VNPPALGEAATQLPWLSPCAAALVTLARSPTTAAWSEVRLDPGCVLLLVREAAVTRSASGLSFFPSLLRHEAVLEAALRHLHQPAAGFVDWNRPAVRPVYQAGLTFARLARALAERTGACDPENAWVAGLLAPLGWLAVAAVDPEQVAACLDEPDLAGQAGLIQQRLWGLDQAAIARRLSRRWQLPLWLAAVTGHLGLPLEAAQPLGAEPGLFRVVQLAVGLAQRQGVGLGLPVGTDPAQVAAALGLSAGDVGEAVHSVLHTPPRLPLLTFEPPDAIPLLPDLLRLAAENRRLEGGSALARLEQDVDSLQRALEEQRAGEAERLRTQKLGALAELAAGAGHEINNPLAVISGQAQYLLKKVSDPAPTAGEAADRPPADRAALAASCQAIIGQAQRIHQILSDLMLFARPPRPQKHWVDVPGLVSEVAASLGELAAHRRVKLAVDCSGPAPLGVHGDPRLLRTALAALLRNAVEAAPAEGWAGVRLQTPAPGLVDVVVEDSGPGPAAADREHLFDPFYSGRKAGRGRGLGLSTAWRLAREHGGDVRFDAPAEGPTRFVLTLPLAAGGPNPEPAHQGCEGRNGSLVPSA
jgi:signal transduction histidine kinase